MKKLVLTLIFASITGVSLSQVTFVERRINKWTDGHWSNNKTVLEARRALTVGLAHITSLAGFALLNSENIKNLRADILMTAIACVASTAVAAPIGAFTRH